MSGNKFLEAVLKELESHNPTIYGGFLTPDMRTREVNDHDQKVKSEIYNDGSVVVAGENLYVGVNDARLSHGVFFFEFERSIYGRDLFPWTQAIGDCVSFGAGGAAQDGLTIGHVLTGGLEDKLATTVATEPIYGGSRVEVGGGRLRGDGSLGSWAAKWVKDWGIVLRQSYGDIDLTTYSGSRAKQYGSRGCPDSLEDDAKLHPMGETADVKNGDVLVSMLCNLNPVTLASDVGFERSYRKNGVCLPSGRWAHQMFARGVAKGEDGNIYIAEQNSWGNYIRGEGVFTTASGRKVTLPKGCFMTPLDSIERNQISRGDCWAYRSPVGWQATPKGIEKIMKIVAS